MKFRILLVAVFCSTVGCKKDSTSPLRVPATPAPTTPDRRIPGQAYFGAKGYVEYVAGNAPIILTAPHGGALTPAAIPDRTSTSCGGTATTVTDANTAALVRAMQQSVYARYGVYPHVIISHLSRRKLDPNRVGIEAACGNVEAAAALAEWHAFIDEAKALVVQTSGRGWYMDVHGHAHAVPRLELGYLLTSANLNASDSVLNASATLPSVSSIGSIAQQSAFAFSDVVRGPRSLGALFASRGFAAIPSDVDPRPDGAEYFNGGDNTRRHGCGRDAMLLGGRTDGMICGVQLEANFAGVRDNVANRERFADTTAVVLEVYLREQWGLRLSVP